jgi:hypothetical protein
VVDATLMEKKNPDGVPGLPVHMRTGRECTHAKKTELMIAAPLPGRHSAIAIFLS